MLESMLESKKKECRESVFEREREGRESVFERESGFVM